MDQSDIRIGAIFASAGGWNKFVKVKTVDLERKRLEFAWLGRGGERGTYVGMGFIEFCDGRFVQQSERTAEDFREHLELKMQEAGGWTEPIGFVALAGLHIAEAIDGLANAVRGTNKEARKSREGGPGYGS